VVRRSYLSPLTLSPNSTPPILPLFISSAEGTPPEAAESSAKQDGLGNLYLVSTMGQGNILFFKKY
jgi:hypothetical protein